MTYRHLQVHLFCVLAVYALAIVLGLSLRWPYNEEATGYYQIYKDLIPLIVAIPAAYLAFSFQRRNSYLQALRTLWSHMVDGIAAALVYTDTPSPSQAQYYETLEKLSVAIEEVRGVFKNVPAPDEPDGWYPFEPIKQIRKQIFDLGYGEQATPEMRAEAKDQIYKMWKASRGQLLREFDRDRPTHYYAHFVS